jgi:DNA polymerase-3 subunit beta
MQTKTRPGTKKGQVKENGSVQTKTKADTTTIRTESLAEKKPKVETKAESPVENNTDSSTPVLSMGMRLICTQENLATHLDLVSHAVPAKPTHPILGNVLLIANQETQKVQLSVFDLNLGIQT